MRKKYIIGGEEISATSYNQAIFVFKLRSKKKEEEKKDHLSFAEKRWKKFLESK